MSEYATENWFSSLFSSKHLGRQLMKTSTGQNEFQAHLYNCAQQEKELYWLIQVTSSPYGFKEVEQV